MPYIQASLQNSARSQTLAEDDPRHPYRWPKFKKWTHVVLFSLIEFVTPLASMMFAPVVPQVARDIGGGDVTATTLAVSVYVLGFIVGPLIFGPLSQLYGRMVIYRTTVLVYLAMSIGCARSTSISILITFRFLAGCFGAAPIVIGGAAVADMFPVLSRGRPMAAYSAGPFLGLTTGPIFGGLINFYSSWRWIFWTLSLAGGFLSFCTFAILRETHLPTLERRLRRTSSTRWSDRLKARLKLRFDWSASGKHIIEVLLPAFSSPVRITFSDGFLFLLFAFNAVFTGIMNLLFYTLGADYQSQYHFSTQYAGLSYLGLAIGGVISSVVLTNTSDKMVRYLSVRLGKSHLERYRLPPVMVGTVLASAGLIWYGWAMRAQSYWLVPLVGTFLFGLGMLSIQAGVPTYLLHAYADQAGAVLSASMVTRSIGGSTIALAGPALNGRLGYGWACTLLAAINMLFLVPTIALWIRPKTRNARKDSVEKEQPKKEEDARVTDEVPRSPRKEKEGGKEIEEGIG